MTHFYLDGKPYYTVKGKDGKERATTLRDARKVNACIGVTSVIGQLDKPGLNYWLLTRLLEVVEQQKHLIGKSEDWQKILLSISEGRNSQYSKEGNRIHDAIELYFNEGIVEPENEALVYPTVQLLEQMYPDAIYESEKSFCHPDGFGGCIDLVIHTSDGKILVDFKTKNKSGLSSKMCGDDYCMQLAAYAKAEGKDDVIMCQNILISLENPGEVFTHIWSDEQLERGEKMFMALLEFWKLSNNYGVK
jgi:hypothetical protein